MWQRATGSRRDSQARRRDRGWRDETRTWADTETRRDAARRGGRRGERGARTLQWGADSPAPSFRPYPQALASRSRPAPRAPASSSLLQPGGPGSHTIMLALICIQIRRQRRHQADRRSSALRRRRTYIAGRRDGSMHILDSARAQAGAEGGVQFFFNSRIMSLLALHVSGSTNYYSFWATRCHDTIRVDGLPTKWLNPLPTLLLERVIGFTIP